MEGRPDVQDPTEAFLRRLMMLRLKGKVITSRDWQSSVTIA
jgi:hypothetical protein